MERSPAALGLSQVRGDGGFASLSPLASFHDDPVDEEDEARFCPIPTHVFASVSTIYDSKFLEGVAVKAVVHERVREVHACILSNTLETFQSER